MSLDALADVARKSHTLDLVTRHACGLTIVRYDRSMRYTYASGANLAKSGIEPSAMVGRGVEESLRTTAPELAACYAKAVRGELVVRRWTGADGARYLMRWVPLVDDDGEVREVIKFTQCVSDLEAEFGDAEVEPQ